MCRHVAWLGEPRTLAAVVLDPPCGLLTQSWAPRRQQRGVANADGWGVGFFTPGRPAPARWRSARPLWGDASFASVAPAVSSAAVLAAVRSASVGMPIDEASTAPFTDGQWLLSHNGRVDRAALPVDHEAESMCDAALLAALVFDRGVDALSATLHHVAAHDPDAVMNLLMTDGDRVLGTTWGDTLCYRVEPDGVLVASEPGDDEAGWVDVPDRHLIEVTRQGVTVTRMEP